MCRRFHVRRLDLFGSAVRNPFVRAAVERQLEIIGEALNSLSTRYDKTTTSYPGFIEIVSARLWFRHLST